MKKFLKRNHVGNWEFKIGFLSFGRHRGAGKMQYWNILNIAIPKPYLI